MEKVPKFLLAVTEKQAFYFFQIFIHIDCLMSMLTFSCRERGSSLPPMNKVFQYLQEQPPFFSWRLSASYKVLLKTFWQYQLCILLAPITDQIPAEKNLTAFIFLTSSRNTMLKPTLTVNC